MEWVKTVLPDLVSHPDLDAYKSGPFRRILKLVELSVREDPPGVVSYSDVAIAKKVGSGGVEQWLDLRDELVADKLLYIWIKDDGRHYVISRKILFDQTVKTKEGVITYQDVRPAEGSLRLNQLTLDYIAANVIESRGANGKRQPVSGAERKALCVWRAKVESERGYRPDPEEVEQWRSEYRAKRAGEPSGSPADSQNGAPIGETAPETEGNGNEKSGVTSEAPVPSVVTESVTNPGNGNGPNRTDQTDEIDQTDSSIPPSACEEADPVTETGNGNENAAAVDFVTERAKAIEFMSITGVTVGKGELVRIDANEAERIADLLWERDKSFECVYDQARRLPGRPHKDGMSWAGRWVASMAANRDPTKRSENPWGGPPSYDAAQREKADREKRAADRAQKAAETEERRREEEERKDAENARLWSLEQSFTEEERIELDKLIRDSLSSFHRDRLEKWERDNAGEPPYTALQQTLDLAKRKVLLQWRK